MDKDFSGVDAAFADFFEDQRGSLRKSFGAAVAGDIKREYAQHAAVDLGNIAELGRK